MGICYGFRARRLVHVLAALSVVAGCDSGHSGDSGSEPTRGVTRTAEPATPLSDVAASARGFPAMWTIDGSAIAVGSFARWVEGGDLRVRIRYDLTDGRVIEEAATLTPGPPLSQRSWSWTESRGDTLRHFEVDFGAGTARTQRREEGEVERDEGVVEVEPGVTFAGFGFTLALEALRDRLVDGEVVELEAVAFILGPRVVTVEISHGGVERMTMGSRELRGDRFDIVPQIPGIVDLFVEVPVTHIWLTEEAPVEFLRWEGPLVEPTDARVRVDLLPGTESGPAEPAGRAPAR